jgi:N-acetylglucosaminyldiphosphoundecaprenol N-acetyl-beta-D-mannosaminyltransferase
MHATPLPVIPHIHVMGVRVHAFTVASLHDCIADIARANQRAIVANVNVNAMNLAYEQPWFAEFLNRAEYVFCDGHGVMLAARMAGQRLPEKITYAVWLPQLAGFCARNDLSIYLLGGNPGIAEQAGANLIAMHPDLRLAGTHHGFFDRETESMSVVQQINESRPDILLVAFGMPVQESWLNTHWDALNAKIGLTGGGALDYASGAVRRPPRWLTESGFEWLGRMCLDPGRLWRRYLVGNPKFMLRVLRERLRTGTRAATTNAKSGSPPD